MLYQEDDYLGTLTVGAKGGRKTDTILSFIAGRDAMVKREAQYGSRTLNSEIVIMLKYIKILPDVVAGMKWVYEEARQEAGEG